MTPPVSNTFIAPSLVSSLFVSLPLCISLHLCSRLSHAVLLDACLAPSRTSERARAIVPVSLRPLSSHSLRLSATLTTEQPQESMHPGSLLPAANDPTFQAFSLSPSLLFPHSACSVSLSASLLLSLSLPRMLDLRFSLHAQSIHASASIRD